jgi:hypothetical protein
VSASFAHRAILRIDTRILVLKAIGLSVVFGVIFTALQV